MYSGYKSKVQPLSPVAVKLNQSEVHAPEHVTWGVVTCDTCHERFDIGPNRIYGARGGEMDLVKQFELILALEHEHGAEHQNAYELPD